VLNKNKKLILKFSDVTKKDLLLVGGKNASLGEMIRYLGRKGVRIPDGFIVTSSAYKYFIQYNNLEAKIRSLVKSINIKDINDLKRKGKKLRSLILNASFPSDLKQKIEKEYEKLEKKYERNIAVAARSSATAEDLPTASFAGQHDTFLNLKGKEKILEGVKRCFASLFTDRAISYREDQGFDHMKVFLSVGIQIMVRSNKASSGVIFTLDTETGFPNIILINASWGLGEYIVKGVVNPDQFIVFKPTLLKGFYPIIDKKLGIKNKKLIYSDNLNKPTKNKITNKYERQSFCLRDQEIITLSKWAILIEKHYKHPQDVEWAKDGVTGELFIIQSRPETVRFYEKKNILEKYRLLQKGKIITTGFAIGSKIGQGEANVILDAKDIKKFKKGQILVTSATDPDWEPIMKIAKAIVTDRGGRTSHAAIVSRELGIPAVVGTEDATLKIKSKDKITVSSAEGEIGKIYQGILKFKVERIDVKRLKKPSKVKIMMNIGDPDQAFSHSFIPNDGVGLAREEFIVTNFIRIHPLALVDYNNIKRTIKQESKKAIKQENLPACPSGRRAGRQGKKAKRREIEKIVKEIDKITKGYKNKKEFFIDKLAFGIAKIAAAFYPKEVIVRTSDFKTNEYRGLIGGELYEEKEDNPMLGFRGTSRYLDKEFRKAFNLECEALKRVREQMGFYNVKIMFPFVRTVQEGEGVIEIMRKQGLGRGKRGLEIYMMCEIPSNILLGEEFAKIFDGFSIGSNDLTQLILGLDRDNSKVTKIADERNKAVLKAISNIIKIAKRHKKKIGICGQAPSDFPKFAQFLVKEGIDSISLNPDSVIMIMLYLTSKQF